MNAWLQNPGLSYIQAYVRFKDDLPPDVIFGTDQELLDGVDNPKYISGGDWMGFIGLQRTGALWVAAGTAETSSGKPSISRSWKIQTLNAPLKPETWYRIRTVVDFGQRTFTEFMISGDGLNQTVDLSTNMLDYPNYMPFDKRTMTYYVHAMRGRDMAKESGAPAVYFDDIEAGIISNGVDLPVIVSDLETQTSVGAQPIVLPVIRVSNYTQGLWYLERDESLIRIERQPFARSGNAVIACDATLF